MNQEFPSTLLEKAVNEFAKLPGVGRKTAVRFVLHILKQEIKDVEKFANSMLELVHNIKYCEVCHNISDDDICKVCSSKSRDESIVCVVESIKDVMAIEATQQYRGVYHVLGGIISPMDGVGPNDINIKTLINRVKEGSIKEIILALSATMEGDTTNFYINRRLEEYDVKVTMIARGVSIGDELEYADEITLGRSIINRTEFNNRL